ncbi:hypothetical protein [Methanobrevibacter sp.]|uniref:hypothetical protein n=1 Tax=Methanobrevibacter sp. TaxID=66852 RepID=UPI0038701240
MTRTKIADLTTDSNGQATYTYTGDGSGEIGFQAKCGSKKSNTLIIDDYVPRFSKVTSIWNTTSPVDGQTFIVTAYVKDQHGVTFEEETLVSMFIDGRLIDSKTSQEGTAEFSTVVHTGSHVLTLRAEDYVKNYNFTVVPGYDGMSLEKTAGNQILSYADEQQTPGSQTCTVTAQLKNGQSSATISSVPVVFGAYKDNVLITGSEQTVNTDANGQASYTYTSAGVGDVVIKAIPDSRSLLQETYAIEDCIKYIQNPTSSSGLNISVPSSAQITYKMIKTGIGANKGGCSLLLQDNSSHDYYIGNWSSDAYNGVLIRNRGSSSNLVDQRCSDIIVNTQHLIGVTYNDGSWTYFKDNEVKSFTANYTPTKITTIDNGQQSTMSDLKVKPL